ncbi:UDP-glucose 4-epimerase GalE [Desulfosporosinus sp. BG]|uniref:UDP-glucose 4-epimerase GalE n=1 Tax=Desulfosporosinus sp. BG TaxID=1633135 RepID=UPI00083AF4D0|nr:UDP-glucose 4-epimerase GalE [Desulfosporosinus sp. BG]ODA40258.1 UDP-glucose 4-epimerase [Desulfosporosinus sp. BG]
MSSILVTGGAGYIGSHTVRVLREKGAQVVVLDSLVTGHREAVPAEVPFYQGDISDADLVRTVVESQGVEAVIHFAARSLVGESMTKPDLYFYENTAKTNLFVANLLQLGVNKIVFSSTAAVYGLPETIPIPEESPTTPINPYGLSKRMIEESFRWLEKAYGLKWVALRYFNAAGAALDGAIGEEHFPETHLIPLVLKTALGQREAIQVFGTDYNTPDGTCIRDYIHVLDLAEAHILALKALDQELKSGVFNVGTGHGYSVREVINIAKKVTGIDIPVVEAARRSGDPDVLVAKVDKIEKAFGLKAKYSDLETIISSAWTWHKNNPEGYKSIS